MSIKLADHICFKLYVASRLVIRGFDDDLSPLHLTYPKYLVLLALGEEDGMTVGLLAERLSLDFGTLSPLLKSLALTGYVRRQRQTQDERVVANFLTPVGAAVLVKAQAIAGQLFCDTKVTHEEYLQLHALMSVFIARSKDALRIRKEKQKARTPSKPKRPNIAKSMDAR